MQMNYTLERKGQKWVVLKKAGGGGNPHGADMPAPGATPSPTPSGDLPPVQRVPSNEPKDRSNGREQSKEQQPEHEP